MVAQGHIISVRLVAEVTSGIKFHRGDQALFNICFKERNL